MKTTLLLFLTLLALGSQAVFGQYELIKKLEVPRIHAQAIFADGFESGDTSAWLDADGDGDQDLVFFRPDPTGPTGHDAIMHIVTDVQDPEGRYLLELQGNQGWNLRDPATPFLGFVTIWPDMGQQGIRSFAFGGEGFYLYDTAVTNPDGRLIQAFTLNREVYRFFSLSDVDRDGQLDVVVGNIEAGTIEVYGSPSSSSTQ